MSYLCADGASTFCNSTSVGRKELSSIERCLICSQTGHLTIAGCPICAQMGYRRIARCLYCAQMGHSTIARCLFCAQIGHCTIARYLFCAQMGHCTIAKGLPDVRTLFLLALFQLSCILFGFFTALDVVVDVVE